jgi:hypothetical protein
VDEQSGEIKPGHSNIPGTEALRTADLMVIFTRFQNLPVEQMQPIVDYLARGGPVVGLRTATHGFKIPAGETFARFDYQYRGDEFIGGFGRQILGETWVGHYGPNHRSSTRLDVVSANASHPILRGVSQAWSELGGYNAWPIEGSDILMMAQPLAGMTPEATNDESKVAMAGAWIRSYRSPNGMEGRVFTTTYGGPGDLVNDGFRRLMVNACLWAMGLEEHIRSDLETSLVGPFRPSWMKENQRAGHVKPQELAGWDTPIWPAP